jgi:hypothetical protein
VNVSQIADGPGPKDPSLPQVIDISKANVIYSIIPGQNGTNQNEPIQSPSSQASIPTESQIDLNKHELVVQYSNYPQGYDPLTQKTPGSSTTTNNIINTPNNTPSQNTQSQSSITVPKVP